MAGASRSSLDGGTIGFLAGCTIIGLTTWIVLPLAAGASFVSWDHQWDTIAVGVLAVLAAVFSIRQVSRQIAQVDEQRRDDLERQNDASRAVMPLTLSAICDHQQKCIDDLRQALPNPPFKLAVHAFQFPPLPNESTGVLRDCVRFSDGPKRREIADLVRALQPQQARLQALSEERYLRTRVNIIENIIYSLEIYARSSSLFRYARQLPDGEPTTLQDARNLCIGAEGTEPDVDKRLQKVQERFLCELQSYRTSTNGFP